MKNIDREYLDLVKEIIREGESTSDRTGDGTKSVFGKVIEHDMSTGFPLIRSKRTWFKGAATELLWILNGRTDLDYLHKHGVKYWDDDYKRSGRNDGTLGPVYGHQWRNGSVDQLFELVKNMCLTPESRRLMIDAWNPDDLGDMALPPCHFALQLKVRNGYLDLIWYQRSADVFLGLPYDIAMYGLLLELLAFGRFKPGRLVGMLGDCHIYNSHASQAKELASRTYNNFKPELVLSKGIEIATAHEKLFIPELSSMSINNYYPREQIKAPLIT